MQETIPLGFHQCQLIAEKDKQIPDLTLLLAPLGLCDEMKHRVIKGECRVIKRTKNVKTGIVTLNISAFSAESNENWQRSSQKVHNKHIAVELQ